MSENRLSNSETHRLSTRIRDNSKPILKDINQAEVGKLSLNGQIFITDPTSSAVQHTIQKYHSNSYGDIKTGEVYTKSELFNKFGGEFRFKIADVEQVRKITEEISKRKFTRLNRSAQKVIRSAAIDVETLMTDRQTYNLGNLYSLSGARMFDDVKEINAQGTGGRHERAMFSHYYKDGKGKWHTKKMSAAELYVKQQSKYNKSYRTLERFTNPDVATEAARLDLLSKEDVKILNSGKISKSGDPAAFKNQVKRYINTKHQFQQSQLRPYIKSSQAIPSVGNLRNIKFGQAPDIAMGIYDQANYHMLVDDYLKGGDIFKKKTFGTATQNIIKMGSELKPLRDKYRATPSADQARVAAEIHKEAAKTFQKRTGAKLLNISGKKFDIGGMKFIESVDTTDLEAIYSSLLDLDVQGNQGSEMETNTFRAMRDKITKSRNISAKDFDTLFGNRKLSFMDGMGRQISDLSLFMTKGWKGGSMGPEMLRSTFYDMYGSNQAFAEITGLNRHEVRNFQKGMYERVFNRYAGNKGVESKQRISGQKYSYKHLAEVDAYADASSTAMSRYRLRQIAEIDSLPPTPYSAFKKRNIQTSYLNEIISEDVRGALRKKIPGISDQHISRVQAEMKKSAYKRMGVGAKAEREMTRRAQVAIDRVLKSDRHQPKSFAKTLTHMGGAGSLGQMFGGALLTSGVVTTAALLTERMKNHPMLDSRGNIEGMSHNSMSTMLDRLNRTDFGSGRRSGNPASLNTLQIFMDTLGDTQTARDSKSLFSNYSTNVKRAYRKDRSVSGAFKAVTGQRNQLLRDTGRVVRHVNESAGHTITSWGKQGHLPELGKFLQRNLIRPTKEAITGKRPLSKLLPKILSSPIGKIGLAAGAAFGIALHLLSSPGKKKTKTAQDFTADNGMPVIQSYNSDKRAEAFALTLRASGQKGMPHGSLVREYNRIYMTDFRSEMAEGQPTSTINAASLVAPSIPSAITATEDIRSSVALADMQAQVPMRDVAVAANIEVEQVINRLTANSGQDAPAEPLPDSGRITSHWIDRRTPSKKYDTMENVTDYIDAPKSGRGVHITPRSNENKLRSDYVDIQPGYRGNHAPSMSGLRTPAHVAQDIPLSELPAPPLAINEDAYIAAINDPIEQGIGDDTYPRRVPLLENSVNDLDKSFYNVSKGIYPRELPEPDTDRGQSEVIPEADMSEPVVRPSPSWTIVPRKRFSLRLSTGHMTATMNMLRSGSPLGSAGYSGTHRRTFGRELFSGALG